MGTEVSEQEPPMKIELSCGHNYRFRQSDETRFEIGALVPCYDCTVDVIGTAKANELGEDGVFSLPDDQQQHRAVKHIIQPD